MLQIHNQSASVTRPADTTAYVSGDLLANSTTAGSVTPLSWSLGNTMGVGQFRLRRIRLSKTGTGTSGAVFRVHFYQASPTVANGDNGAWSTNKAADYLGMVDIASVTAFTDGAAGQGAPTTEFNIRMSAGTTLYGLIEVRGAYTPASAEVVTVVIEEIDDE